MAAITYGKRVIIREQYFGRINADISFLVMKTASMFKTCPNPKGNFFLQDGDISQNSCNPRSAWDKIGTQKFSVAARSPDLNTMENIFDIVKKKLHQDDLEMKKIECEGLEGFSAQVKTKLESVPVAVLD